MFHVELIHRTSLILSMVIVVQNPVKRVTAVNSDCFRNCLQVLVTGDCNIEASPRVFSFFLISLNDLYDRSRTDDEVWAVLGPLMEALLAKGEDYKADRIFSEFRLGVPSAELQAKLIQIATKRNKPALARK